MYGVLYSLNRNVFIPHFHYTVNKLLAFHVGFDRILQPGKCSSLLPTHKYGNVSNTLLGLLKACFESSDDWSSLVMLP